MSTSQDASQRFHQYDSDDRQILVGLLHEYSDKLVEASREIARKKTGTNRVQIFTFVFCLLISVSASYLFWRAHIITTINTKELANFGLPILSTAILLLPIVLFLVLLFFSETGLFSSFSLDKQYQLQEIEKDLLKKDARLIANRLESAMRLTVEVADQVETNLARKLELDLRIDDASSALEYYYSVVNLKVKPQVRSRKVIH